LASANSDLALRTQDRLLVIPSNLSASWNLDWTIDILSPLVERYSALKIWILGDNRNREQVYARLRYHGIHREVIMPGVFCDVIDVLQAADLCLFPSADSGLSWLVGLCVSNAIPVLAGHSPDLRWMYGPALDGSIFAAGSADQLTRRLVEWNEHSSNLPSSAQKIKEHLRHLSAQDHSGQSLADLLGSQRSNWRSNVSSQVSSRETT
jgi:glycosyltransferase involved in cell wall biosynthesis